MTNKHNLPQKALWSVLLLGTLATLSTSAGSYTITIPGSVSFPLAWSFQPTNVAAAFPAPDNFTTLYFWDPSAGNYVENDYISGYGWTDPNYVIANGIGFYYANPSSQEKTLTVSGVNVSASSVTYTFQAGKAYFLGSAYLQPSNNGNYIECVSKPPGPPYTDSTLSYSFNYGDKIYRWDDGNSNWTGGIRSTNYCGGPASPFWQVIGGTCSQWAFGDYQSANIFIGHGFWYYPVANTNWTQHSTESSCP